MRIVRLSALLPILLSFGAATLLSSAEPAPVPEKFNASIGGFGLSYTVELRNGVLLYTENDFRRGKPVAPQRITPTPEQWREFRRTLDAAGVWNWQKRYPSAGTVDGTQWSFAVAYGGRVSNSAGDNNYPGTDGKPTGDPMPTKTFERVRAAISALLGGRKFQ